MKTKNLFMYYLAMAFMVFAGLSAFNSCSKDDSGGPGGGEEPKLELEIACAVKDSSLEYARFDVVCHSSKSVYSYDKYFYVDTVPYSTIQDPYKQKSRKGKTGGNLTTFKPEANSFVEYHEKEGEMVAVHPTVESQSRRFYIGAYVIMPSGGPRPDTVWCEPFVYDAPWNGTFTGKMTIRDITAHSATCVTTFSRPVGYDDFLGNIRFELLKEDEFGGAPDTVIYSIEPYKGRKSELTVTVEDLKPDTYYCFSLLSESKFNGELGIGEGFDTLPE